MGLLAVQCGGGGGCGLGRHAGGDGEWASGATVQPDTGDKKETLRGLWQGCSGWKLAEAFGGFRVFFFFSKVDWVLKHQTQRTMTRMMMMNNNNDKKMMKDER